MDWEIRAATLLLYLGVLLATIHQGNADKRVVCYYTNWSIYRPGTAKFSPQNINPYLCTHLIYAFGGFTKDNALRPFDKYQDIEKGGYAKFNGLKTYNKNLKTMLAIGGWNEGSSRFSPMVADPDRRREFVKNSVKFLRQNHFDGLDLDWEYPAFRDGGKPRDKDNYASLVQELREEFERESSKTGRSRLLLSMAVPAGIEYIDKGYDVPKLNEYLDFINLLSYDYHSAYEPAVNHHSPLYPLEEDNEYNYDSELTIDYTINHLLDMGASSDKIVLGIPTYGRSYTLFNEDATDLGSPADGPGIEGDATREKGYLAYYEICENLEASDDWEVIQPNPKAMGPYAFKGNQWVGYDDEEIVRLKAKYVNEKKLGGIMFWSIDNDDFRGKCHDRPYPLIEAAKESLLAGRTNTVQKSKPLDSRKKSRPQGIQSNAIGRKLTGGRRSTTTQAPVTRKRVTTPRTKYRTITRPKVSVEEEEEEEEEVEEKEVDRRSYDSTSVEEDDDDSERGNVVKIAEKRERPRPKNKGRAKSRPSSNRNRRKQVRRKEEEKNEESREESLSNKLTTPQPPTTPDPGTDFKCEDEGFFSHPRDCKKYFWCLDSGPGGLGVVAHQFTCPSGLVFNKAADSCDYPRNVVCPKAKTSQSSPSTTRAPITAATSRTTYLYSTTRRTTTEKAEPEEEYEYYDDDDDESEEEVVEEKEEPKVSTTSKPLLYKTINRSRPTTSATTTTTTTTTTTSKPERGETEKEKVVLGEDEEEDPRVIKELIDLIKKAGGIEQLEKQLLFQEKNSDTVTNNERVTPATISRSLYERVLSRQANKIAGQRPTSSRTNFANGPGGAQFEGLDEVPEVKSLRRTYKHQYVNIERPKASTKEPPVDDEEIEEDEDETDVDNTDVASSEERTVSNQFLTSSTQRATPNYVNIRRARPSTTTSRVENDVEEKKEEAEEDEPPRRRRPVTFKNIDSNKSTEDSSELESHVTGSEDATPTTKSRYVNVQRFRSTTARTPEDATTESAANSPIQESTTESSVSTKTSDLEDEWNSVSSTSSPILSSTSIIVSTSVDSIHVIFPENVSTIAALPEVNATTESVKLVEESATEILLTTAPASSSQTVTSVSIGRITAGTVSQPRPFGFTRRNRPAATPEVASTTPLPSSSNDQTRSKVSISTRNQTRASFLVGRGRIRPRQESVDRSVENEQVERPRTTVDESSAGVRETGRSRYRGTSRFTPPTFRGKQEEPAANSVGERGPTRTSSETPRRRFRRPSSKISTEATRSNELEDSPIVRIAQEKKGRRASTLRSRNSGSNEEEREKVTNIKVFKRPTVNRDIYSRTKYANKRNNADTEEHRINDDTSRQVDQEDKLASPLLYATASTLSFLEAINGKTNSSVGIVTTLAPITENSADEVDGISPVGTTTEAEVQAQETTLDPGIEANTVDSILTTESTVENEVTATFGSVSQAVQGFEDRNTEIPITTERNPVVQSADVDLIKIVFNTNMANPADKESNGSPIPRRRKVLLRRRPVVSSSPATDETGGEKQLPRRRKVIKRLRPVNGDPALNSAELSSTEVEQLYSRSTTVDADETKKLAGDEKDVTRMEDATEALDSPTTEYAKTDYNSIDDISRVTLESPGSGTTIISEDMLDLYSTTPTATLFEESTKLGVTEFWTGSDKIISETERSVTEPATSTAFIINYTETDNVLEETLLPTSKAEIPSTTVPSQVTPTIEADPGRLQPYNRTSDSRYVRKKFLRRRPVSSSENITSRYPPISRTLYRVSSTTERSDTENVSKKRRKSLFVRRRPVSSTTRTTQSIEEDQGLIEEEDEVESESRIGLEEGISRVTVLPDSSAAREDSSQFWSHYTTAEPILKSQSDSPQFDLSDDTVPLENRETAVESQDEEANRYNVRKPEFRPRYKVPASLKKTLGTQEASPRTLHHVDSSPEESEETPETNDSRSRIQGFRQPRTRYKNQNEDAEEESFLEATESSLDSSTLIPRTRFYIKRPITTTEQPVTETLIPAKKFDYVADAHRRQQSLRTTPRTNEDNDSSKTSNDEREEIPNYVDTDYTTPSMKPQVTRLVTSVEESATTERQKILIKTKYSSLTSTTRIPVQSTMSNRGEHLATTLPTISDTLERSTKESAGDRTADESLNEIRQGVERSTLSIEGEFLYRDGRFTTESQESSTIEIESVFNNLIAGKES